MEKVLNPRGQVDQCSIVWTCRFIDLLMSAYNHASCINILMVDDKFLGTLFAFQFT